MPRHLISVSFKSANIEFALLNSVARGSRYNEDGGDGGDATR
jgi:hypothetical protein